jgi:hypothetical protein
MNDGIVPPLLVGGVTNAFVLPADLGGEASVKEAGLETVGRGIEDGDMGRGFTEGGGVIGTTGLCEIAGRGRP